MTNNKLLWATAGAGEYCLFLPVRVFNQHYFRNKGAKK